MEKQESKSFSNACTARTWNTIVEHNWEMIGELSLLRRQCQYIIWTCRNHLKVALFTHFRAQDIQVYYCSLRGSTESRSVRSCLLHFQPQSSRPPHGRFVEELSTFRCRITSCIVLYRVARGLSAVGRSLAETLGSRCHNATQPRNNNACCRRRAYNDDDAEVEKQSIQMSCVASWDVSTVPKLAWGLWGCPVDLLGRFRSQSPPDGRCDEW